MCYCTAFGKLESWYDAFIVFYKHEIWIPPVYACTPEYAVGVIGLRTGTRFLLTPNSFRSTRVPVRAPSAPPGTCAPTYSTSSDNNPHNELHPSVRCAVPSLQFLTPRNHMVKYYDDGSEIAFLTSS